MIVTIPPDQTEPKPPEGQTATIEIDGTLLIAQGDAGKDSLFLGFGTNGEPMVIVHIDGKMRMIAVLQGGLLLQVAAWFAAQAQRHRG